MDIIIITISIAHINDIMVTFTGEYNQIIEFTYNKEKLSIDSESFLIPVQMILPSITPICKDTR